MMPIILSVILFAFKSLFLSGIGFSSTLELSDIHEQDQISGAINDSHLYPILLEDSSIELILIESQEQEEKSETEDLPLLFFVETAIFSISKKDYTDWQISFFSTKAKKEGIHLYDLFDCWKSELV
ncbi:MAG: hypothetical protein ACI9UV_003310 [Algoriphagus sp.]|jgi:hypothetical protein